MSKSDVEIVSKKTKTYFSYATQGRVSGVFIATVPHTVWGIGGIYSGHPASFTPEQVKMSSNSASDDVAGDGARVVRIFGLKTETDVSESYEDVAMGGTLSVSTVGTWWRVYRAIVISTGSAQVNVGNIKIAFTPSATNFVAEIEPGKGMSQQAVFTSPDNCVTVLESLNVRPMLATGAAVMVEGALIVTIQGGGQIHAIPFVAHHDKPYELYFKRGIPLTDVLDMRIDITSTTVDDTIVTAGFEVTVSKGVTIT